ENSQEDTVSRGDDVQRNAAERLLNAVLEGSPLTKPAKRVAVFLESASRSIIRRLFPNRRLASGIHYSLARLLFPLAALFAYVVGLSAIREKSHVSHFASRFFAAGFIVLFIPTLLVTFGTSARSMGVWNLICKNMGISDEIMHRVVGTRYLPWTRGRRFDYYLEEGFFLESDYERPQ
ncbi:MAG: hypothetical protein WAO00_18960, partial [Chthoniobacterales bacterium]